MTRKLKPLPRHIPHFKSYLEEANFWDTHDTASLFNKKEKNHITFSRPVKHLISIRMDRTLMSGLRTLAAKRHLPYQTLIHTLLAEKLRDEFRKSA